MRSAVPRLTRSGRQAVVASMMLLITLLAGCASRQSDGPGGYAVGAGDYRRDGPHANPPPHLDRVPSAVPRIEPYASGPNRPYVINGKRYVPDVSDRPYRVRGMASWYGRQFHGRPTSNGEIYDMYAMTAAHPTLPIPSYVRVSRPDTGKSIIVRINDRGPFHSGRVIDLSYVAAYQLGTLAGGTAEVVVERITPDEIRRGGWGTPPMLATPATPAPTSSHAGSGTFLQLGAFGEARNAELLAERLHAQVSSFGTLQVVSRGDSVYRVQLGPFADRQSASAYVDAIHSQTGIRPHVVAH